MAKRAYWAGGTAVQSFVREHATSHGVENADQHVDPVAGKSVAEVFGEIVWLLSQDREGQLLTVKDLERLVMLPILLKQFHITYAPVPDGRTVEGEPVMRAGAKPRLQPVSVELYAMCSDAVAAALDSVPPGKMGLTMQDWRSGTHKKVVLTVRSSNVEAEQGRHASGPSADGGTFSS